MGLRAEKKLELRRQILDVAIALFRDRGFDETRVQDIIDRVRVSEATFFNYFPTKDAVLQAFAVNLVEGYSSLVETALGDETRSVPDRIRDLFRILAMAFSQDRPFMATVVIRANMFFGAQGVLLEKEMLSYERLAMLFEEGQTRGEIRADLDPMQLAEILTGTYMLIVFNWLIGWWNDEETLGARLAPALEVLLDGCSRTGGVDGTDVGGLTERTKAPPDGQPGNAPSRGLSTSR